MEQKTLGAKWGGRLCLFRIVPASWKTALRRMDEPFPRIGRLRDGAPAELPSKSTAEGKLRETVLTLLQSEKPVKRN